MDIKKEIELSKKLQKLKPEEVTKDVIKEVMKTIPIAMEVLGDA